MIESYKFGEIVIDGTTYTSDVIIYPDNVNDKWWRKEGHLLQKDDLTDVIRYEPDIIIVGTGEPGLMKVPDEPIVFSCIEPFYFSFHIFPSFFKLQFQYFPFFVLCNFDLAILSRISFILFSKYFE